MSGPPPLVEQEPSRAASADFDAESQEHAGVQTLAANLRQGSGMQAWMCWCGGLILATLAILVPVMFGYGSGIPVYLMIFGMFAAALYRNWGDMRFLDRETKLASGQVQRLQKLNDVSAFLDEEFDSIFKTHIHSLHTMFQNSPHISQDALIEVLHARLAARNRTVELFASVLITLGLIGTIVGLIISIGGLGGVLKADNSDSAQLLAEMSTTFDGLGTAFVTTLLGALFGGVILRILGSVVDSSILSYSAHIGELTEVYVLPAMRRAAARLEEAGYYRNLGQAPKAKS